MTHILMRVSGPIVSTYKQHGMHDFQVRLILNAPTTKILQ